jgi:hypothetical protein
MARHWLIGTAICFLFQLTAAADVLVYRAVATTTVTGTGRQVKEARPLYYVLDLTAGLSVTTWYGRTSAGGRYRSDSPDPEITSTLSLPNSVSQLLVISEGNEPGLREFGVLRGTKSTVAVASNRTADIPLTLSGFGHALGSMSGQGVRVKAQIKMKLDEAVTKAANDAGEDYQGAVLRVGAILKSKGYTEATQN